MSHPEDVLITGIHWDMQSVIGTITGDRIGEFIFGANNFKFSLQLGYCKHSLVAIIKPELYMELIYRSRRIELQFGL